MATRHYHIESPRYFYCVEATLWGWAISLDCSPERVEPCSEQVDGGVTLLPSADALIAELRRRKVDEGEIAKLYEAVLA